MTPDRRPNYSSIGKSQQNVLRGIGFHLKMNLLLHQNPEEDEDLSSMIKAFGLQRDVKTLRDEMNSMVGDGRSFGNNLETDPQFLADAIELTLLLKINTNLRERESDIESLEFMQAVDSLFRETAPGQDQETYITGIRKKAVELLWEKYNYAKNSIEPYRYNENHLTLTKIRDIKDNEREKWAHYVTDTKPVDIETANQRNKVIEKGEMIMPRTLEPRKKISIARLRCGGLIVLGGLAGCGVIWWSADRLRKLEPSQQLIALGSAGILSLSLIGMGYFGEKLKQYKQHILSKRSNTEDTIAIKYLGIPEELRELVNHLDDNDGVQLLNMSCNVGGEKYHSFAYPNARNRHVELMDQVRDVANYVDSDSAFVVPIREDEHTTHIVVKSNAGCFIVTLEGNFQEQWLWEGTRAETESRPLLNVLNVIDLIRRENKKISGPHITDHDYYVYKSMDKDNFEDLVSGVYAKTVTKDMIRNELRVVHTKSA